MKAELTGGKYSIRKNLFRNEYPQIECAELLTRFEMWNRSTLNWERGRLARNEREARK
jgi:hypothetical protein